MNRLMLAACVVLLAIVQVRGQEDRMLVLEGNRQYNNESYSGAESQYRDALAVDPNSFEGGFNLGDALYRQEKFDEAGAQFQSLIEKAPTKEDKASVCHNLGNCHLQGGKVQEAIDAYKNALRNNPNDDGTRHNLAVAQRMLQQQQQQEQNQDQEGDGEDDQDKKDQDKQDQEKDQEKEEDQKEQEDSGDEGDEEKDEESEKDEPSEDEQDQDKKENENKDGKQPQPYELSKEDAEKLLQQLNRDDKRLQKELQKKKAKKAVGRQIEKDW